MFDPAMSDRIQIDALLSFSARIGRNPLLIQASNGNTSVKLGSSIWVKGSGRWLGHAQAGEERNTLVCLELAELQDRIRHGQDVSGLGVAGSSLRSSIETALHAVIPRRVVVHAHSIHAISWAVRRDGEQRIAERLGGIRWQWIPYTPSGLPLARSIEAALALDHLTQVFILANHGIVVCGDSCEDAESLLHDVDRRLATAPRSTAPPDLDAVGMKILQGGVLYPCQAIFLDYTRPPFPVPPAVGISAPVQQATYVALLEVLRRIPEGAPVRYLMDGEVSQLFGEGTHAYIQWAEENALEPLHR